MDEEKLLFLKKRVLRYLSAHPEGLSGKQILGWLWSIQLRDILPHDAEAVLRALRDDGQIAIANGLWFLRAKV